MSPWEVFGKAVLWGLWVLIIYLCGVADGAEGDGLLIGLGVAAVLGVVMFVALVLPTVAGFSW